MKRLACLLSLVAACGSVKSGDQADGGSDGENDAPTDIDLSAASIEEQAPPGTRVGLLSATDADSGDRHTFDLVDDGGGLFAVDGADLEVAPGAILNYETGATVTVTVKATDDGGLSVEKDIEIDIVDLLEVVNTLNDGEGSLRQTIADAAPGETILFETGLDPSISVNGPLLLTKKITIRGPLPPAEIVLDALENNGVFEISVAADVTLQNLRIRGGVSGNGAVFNQGTLLVERCTIEDSTASGTGRGGAIENRGSLIARDTSFLRNTGFNGGAIGADSADGTTIERCTFQGNQADGNSGGGIVGNSMKVINSTFNNNSAFSADDRVGGAIAVFGAGQSEVVFCTITGNFADGSGGGIYVGSGATLHLRGSIVSGNSSPAGIDIDDSGTLDGDHNVVGAAAGSGLTDGTDGNVVGTTVSLGEMADNGGPTETMLPDDGAASIDLVPGEACLGLDDAALEKDQRGEPRPSGDACDAGSVEK